MADEDGVVIVPPDVEAAVLAVAAEKSARESEFRAAVAGVL